MASLWPCSRGVLRPPQQQQGLSTLGPAPRVLQEQGRQSSQGSKSRRRHLPGEQPQPHLQRQEMPRQQGPARTKKGLRKGLWARKGRGRGNVHQPRGSKQVASLGLVGMQGLSAQRSRQIEGSKGRQRSWATRRARHDGYMADLLSNKHLWLSDL